MHLKQTATRITLLSVIAVIGTGATPSRAAAPTAYVTSETAGVGVIDLDQMTLAKTFPVGDDGPRGLSLNADGTRLLVANKKTGDLAEIDTSTGQVTRRVKIGKNPEFVRVRGGYAYVTYEPGDTGAPPSASGGKDDDDEANKPPAEIAVIDLKSLKVIHSVKSGHETEGVEFSPDGKLLLVTNEGDDTVSVYRVGTGEPYRTVELPKGSRPRGIRASPDGRQYVVTLENSNKFVVLDADDLKTVKTVDTKLGPYGVAFDPSGKHLLVAAARDKTLQVFDAKTYEHISDAEIGQRCWHFSFTPDGTKLLLACGRSNGVYVLDATNYQTIKQIGDLPLAWGIVTWPRSSGSIESR
ncbi:beta-propeller fold lactonase family protein [Paraburkholderia sp. BL10I2N1]|uniref:beta-propeller fold lactonase family protein n=1 Tax=Paraburkholderia sp. BL10I2N1 TaxID=1938796 RepID=UPI00105DB732|nr:beta-propeller fold lactonase family protein [Paraburkholderia sp. BL10I2N1]TDN69346.1 YVTN family beta-propeller protein [Paraburkholderia sp. BL10I2N1]